MRDRGSKIALAALLLALAAGCAKQELDPRVSSMPPVSAAVAPPAISGGTLLVVADGAIAVVADPDRDRLVRVDLVARRVLDETALPEGSQPGRLVEDRSGRVHVVLRGRGEVFTFWLGSPAAGERRAACPMPRGIAHDPDRDVVLVACRGGELVALPASGGPAISSTPIAPDLRDVIVMEGRVFVTRFRSAELGELTTDGPPVWRAPEPITLPQGESLVTFEPAVAWRAIAIPERRAIAMVHQRARASSIEGGYGAPASDASCRSGAVHASITMFSLDGEQTGGAVLRTATLPVDLASHGGDLAIVAAGNQSGARAVFTVSQPDTSLDPQLRDGCALAAPHDASVPIAIAFDGSGERVVLERDPAALLHRGERIALGGRSVFDTGHAIFHGNAGEHVACASCHPEGTEDGRVWLFDGVARRTQSLLPDLTSTAPFHWSGDQRDLGALMGDVFTRRMGGPTLGPEQITMLGRWMDRLPAPRASDRDADAVARGRALFEDAARCAECHSGPMLTNGQTTDVGTGGAFQVPSLIGVSHRLPLMHDGCAASLSARFLDPACGGGESHGRTAALDAMALADLVTYLETL
ncbi:MAG: cytochrome-c peroxidase [Myxococcota bacterium]|nr:cytochrome-c peroxidase [Myxococcota bacterium]